MKIPLIGKGIAPAPKPILPGDKIIPTPKLDEGPDKTKPRDTSVKKICLDFILVDNRDTKTWNKKAQEWTEKSNVKVVFSKPKPVRRIAEDDIKEEVNKATSGQLHCFPVFIVKILPEEAPNASGYTDPEYIGDRGQIGKEADKLAKDHNIHPNYREGMAYGTAIYILQNLDISGTVLAHELGHTLGGGAGERTGHLDPKTGAELDDTDRLMNGQNIRNSSPKITPLEKIIMEWTAEKFVNPNLSKCKQTSKSLIGNYGMIENASISNGGDALLVTTRLFEPLVTEGLFFDYRLSFDIDGDGVGDRMLINTYDGEVWSSQLEGVSLEADSKPVLRFLRRPDGTAHAIAASIPKAMLQKSQGIIGWNIVLEIPDLGITDSLPLFGQSCSGKTRKSALPDLKVFNGDGLILSPVRSSRGFDCFDITNPSLALQAAATEELIPVFAGDIFELEGSLAVSSTFSGEVDLYVGYLHPEGGIMKEILVKHLSEIQAEMGWTASVPVPSGLAPGFYQLVITAVCELCKTETTAFGPMVRVGQFKKLPDLNLSPEPYGGQWDSGEGEKEILLNSRDKLEFQMSILR
ncbi:hypothetical protein [Nitrosococcus oceani]|uniref:hypothetical protein n=1 Tax=Nitrosococcus oceani TaxID=1229 RepID=UPI000AD69F18|nr:hypothetical protein [Nitrosococcus oceani]